MVTDILLSVTVLGLLRGIFALVALCSSKHQQKYIKTRLITQIIFLAAWLSSLCVLDFLEAHQYLSYVSAAGFVIMVVDWHMTCVVDSNDKY